MKTNQKGLLFARLLLILGMVLPFSAGSISARADNQPGPVVITPENVNGLKLAAWMGQGVYTGEIALQPGGDLLAAATSTGVALIDRNKQTQTGFIPLGLFAGALAISPDGKTLAVVFSLPTGKTGTTAGMGSDSPLYRQQINFYSLPDGKASLSSIQDLKDCGPSNISAVAFTPDGAGLLFEKKYSDTNSQKLVCVISVSNGAILRTFPLPQKSESAISPDGKYAAVIQDDPKAGSASLQVLDSKDFKSVMVTPIKYETKYYPPVQFSQTGNAILLQSDFDANNQSGPSYTVLSIPDGKTIFSINISDKDDSIMSFDLLADGQLIALGTQQGMIKVQNLQSGSVVSQIGPMTDLSTSQFGNPGGINSAELPVYVKEVAFTDGGKSLAASEDMTTMGQGGGIHLYQLPDGNEKAVFHGSTLGTDQTGIAFSPDATQIAVGGKLNGDVDVYDLPAGKPVFTLQGHTGTVNDVQYSPDGSLLATGSDDKSIRLWDAKKGTLLRTLTGHQERVTRLVFSPDGKKLVSGADDNSIRLWNVADGSAIKAKNLSAENWEVHYLAFLPDNQSVVYNINKYPSPYVGYIEKQILWNTQSDQDTPIGGDSVFITSLSNDGKYFISVGDGYAKIGSLKSDGTMETTDQFRSPYGNGALTESILSPDHHLIVSGNGFGLHAWNYEGGKAEFIGISAAGEPIPTYGNHYLFSPDGRYLAFSTLGAVYLLAVQG
jgi:WD40 repeat protein